MKTTHLRRWWLVVAMLSSCDPLAAGYRLETISLPAAMAPEVSAVAFAPDGSLYLANRSGEIWRADRTLSQWRRFAAGLQEPLGLYVESSRVVYVTHRPELTRVEDTDGDGVADDFATVNDHWGLTGNVHEFSFGLRRDAEGNFVGALALDSLGEGELKRMVRTRGEMKTELVRQETQWSLVPFRGWSYKITPAGEFVPWSFGFRQPCGIGISPAGELFSTENQGDWIASSSLIHHKRGAFYGHPASLKWTSAGGVPAAMTDEALGAWRTPPTVILPHGALGGSPGEPVWDVTAGKFGAFAGQVFIGDFSRLISRVFLEEIAGEVQGAAFPFVRQGGLRPGNMRMAFSPEGALYIGQTTQGWGAGNGLQRLLWDGRPGAEILAVRLLDSGFALDFTLPMKAREAAPADSIHVSRFRYLYHAKYGSPRIDVARVAVTAARWSEDARRVELTVPELKPGFVYEFQIEDLAANSGELLGNPSAFYTVNRLRTGERFEGPYTRPINGPGENDLSSVTDLPAGKRTYLTYCAACHGEDGRGGQSAAANFVEDPARLGRSDAELIRTIRRGVAATGMPAFGSVLGDSGIRDVLAYIRTSFDPERKRGR